MNVLAGNLHAEGMKVALVVGRFNSFVVDHLVAGAIDSFVRHGGEAEKLTQVMVPGAFEIPLAVKKLALSGDFDAIVALGAVIRGGTPHFEYVAGECVKGLGQVMLEQATPVSFGVLTVDSIEQAIERSGTKAGNKGSEAMLSAIEMINVLKQI